MLKNELAKSEIEVIWRLYYNICVEGLMTWEIWHFAPGRESNQRREIPEHETHVPAITYSMWFSSYIAMLFRHSDFRQWTNILHDQCTDRKGVQEQIEDAQDVRRCLSLTKTTSYDLVSTVTSNTDFFLMQQRNETSMDVFKNKSVNISNWQMIRTWQSDRQAGSWTSIDSQFHPSIYPPHPIPLYWVLGVAFRAES